MNEIWQTVITALGGYTVILGGLFWWIGNRRMQSLLAQEKGKIQKEVNKENAELFAKHQKELEELKARFTVEESVRQMLTGSFSNAQTKVFERRLNYIEELWKAFYILRDSMPAFLTYVDIILEKEYAEWIKRTEVQQVFGDLSMEKITKMSTSLTGDIEKVRPFVGEYLWSLYFVYRTFSFRLVVFIFMERQKVTPKYWKKDDGLKQILHSVLSESEFSNFTSKEVGAIQYVRILMESKFISQVENIITGKSSIQEGVEQARTIMVSAQQATQNTKQSQSSRSLRSG
jgi:hypothetical protein